MFYSISASAGRDYFLSLKKIINAIVLLPVLLPTLCVHLKLLNIKNTQRGEISVYHRQVEAKSTTKQIKTS